MDLVRRNRRALAPIERSIKRPFPYGWTGNKAFNRTKGKKYKNLAQILRDDEFESFCSAIGFIEVTWAFMESQLDHWAQLTFRNLGGNKIEKKLPLGFERKSDYLIRVFKTIPLLAPFRADAVDVLDGARQLAGTRNDLTHAVVTSLESTGGKFELINRKLRSDGIHSSRTVYFDVRDFPDLSLKLVKLGSKAVRLSADLAEKFIP